MLKILFTLIYKVYFKLLVTFYKSIRYVVLPVKSHRILLVKLDSIGDYVLFRNLIACLCRADVYKDNKFSLLGNIAFREIAEDFDRGLIEKFYWIDPKLIHQYPYKLKIILKTKFKAFDTLINPVHSSTGEIDAFISELGAKLKIGSVGDSINMQTAESIRQAKANYNRLIEVPDIDCFEFIRNRKFVEVLTGEQCVQKPEFLFTRKKWEGVRIIVFPGANHNSRRWAPANFAAVINAVNRLVKGKKQFEICGSTSDKELAKEIIEHVEAGVDVIDTTGKTKLSGLISAIGNSDLLISNETVAVHIGAAVGTNTICISNGNHFRRFNPYPDEISDKVTTIYPSKIFYDVTKFHELAQKYKFQSDIDINRITPDMVAKPATEFILGIQKEY